MQEKPVEHWFEKAADAIIREGLTLFAFSNHQGLGLTAKECEATLRTKGFQEILRVRRNLFYKELAQDASWSKAAAEGQIVFAISKMMEKELYDKALEGVMKLAKFKGWISDGTNVNVFQELTQKDLADLRKKFTPPAVSKDN